MDQIDLAIHATAHDFGVPAMARMLGKREQVFRNQVCPTDDTHPVSLRTVVAMMALSGDLRILEALNAEFGCAMVRPERPATPASLIQAVLSTDASHGAVTSAIKSALADGVVSTREQALIMAEVGKARAALSELEAFLREQGRAPGGLRVAS